MVKNQIGGSGAKKYARKNTTTSSSKSSHKLRISEDEGELYAIVTKCLGNNMFHCHCIDNIVRLGHIRGKFSGRGRRDNTIVAGSWILVGIREWDSSMTTKSNTGKVKLQECDLMEVYNDTDKSRLTDSVVATWSILTTNDTSRHATSDSTKKDDADIVHFVTEKELEVEALVRDMLSDTTSKVKITDVEEDEEEINVDDI
jgi:initiation factor 1A